MLYLSVKLLRKLCLPFFNMCYRLFWVHIWPAVQQFEEEIESLHTEKYHYWMKQHSCIEEVYQSHFWYYVKKRNCLFRNYLKPNAKSRTSFYESSLSHPSFLQTMLWLKWCPVLTVYCVHTVGNTAHLNLWFLFLIFPSHWSSAFLTSHRYSHQVPHPCQIHINLFYHTLLPLLCY